MSAVDKYNSIRNNLKQMQKELDKVTTKIGIKINGLIIDLDRLEKEGKKNVVQKERKTKRVL